MSLEALVTFASNNMNDDVRFELYARGVSDEQIQRYRIGYIGNRLPNGLTGKFYNWAKGKKNVFVFPLTTSLGVVRGVQFRYVDRDRKGYADYIEEDCRYDLVTFGLTEALPHIWETEEAWIVEGTFDVFPIQRTFPNVFPTLTARVTDSNVRFLRRLVKRVYLLYDMDEPGRKACDYFQSRYGKEFEVRVPNLPLVNTIQGERVKDISDLWETWGEERTVKFLRSLRGY